MALRFSNAEYAAVRKAAARAKLTVGRYIRQSALTCDLGPTITRDLFPVLTSAGKNLNGYVLQCHINEPVDTRGLRQVLDSLRDHVSQLAPEGAGGAGSPLVVSPGPRERFKRGQLRCRPDEAATIRTRAELTGLSQAAFVRAAALQQPLGRRASGGVVRELLRILNNLRQLYEVGPTVGVISEDVVDALIYQIEDAITYLLPQRR